MSNKVALITGGSRGLGKAISTVFSKNHIDVVINYKNSKKEAEELATFLQQEYKVQALAIQGDVSLEEDVVKMIDIIKEKFHRLDIIVNNAGIAHDSIFLDKSKEDFMNLYATNLVGAFLVCKYGTKIMEKGSIVQISSTNGIDTTYTYSADYDASKAALISLSNNLAEEFAPSIRVNTVASGWIKTDMTKDLADDYVNDEESRILLKRFADPFEIAEVVYFLTTDKASYVNKAVIRVDGGYCA